MGLASTSVLPPPGSLVALVAYYALLARANSPWLSCLFTSQCDNVFMDNVLGWMAWMLFVDLFVGHIARSYFCDDEDDDDDIFEFGFFGSPPRVFMWVCKNEFKANKLWHCLWTFVIMEVLVIMIVSRFAISDPKIAFLVGITVCGAISPLVRQGYSLWLSYIYNNIVPRDLRRWGRILRQEAIAIGRAESPPPPRVDSPVEGRALKPLQLVATELAKQANRTVVPEGCPEQKELKEEIRKLKKHAKWCEKQINEIIKAKNN
ncbi:hypothetical protein RI054_05g30150 [Pseudoscourfieldia marina]